ncbi:MAG: hypothetical protein ACRDC6_10130, partial [Shewanella sp.]
GVCKRHKQAEYPWPTGQKASSVAATRGWSSCSLMVDLGNNTSVSQKVPSVAITWDLIFSLDSMNLTAFNMQVVVN